MEQTTTVVITSSTNSGTSNSYTLQMTQNERENKFWQLITAKLVEHGVKMNKVSCLIGEILIKYDNYGRTPVYDMVFIGEPNPKLHKLSTYTFRDKNQIKVTVFENN